MYKLHSDILTTKPRSQHLRTISDITTFWEEHQINATVKLVALLTSSELITVRMCTWPKSFATPALWST